MSKNLNIGYYRDCDISGNNIVFVSGDDLWVASIGDGTKEIIAQRLTETVAQVRHPKFSPDGKTIAFSSEDEGHLEIYTINIDGSNIKRLSYLGETSNAVGWLNDITIIFSSTWKKPMPRTCDMYAIDLDGIITDLQLPHVRYLSFKGTMSLDKIEKADSVIQIHGYREYSYWKRYRGGTAGLIMQSQKGGAYKVPKCLEGLASDLSRPVFLGNDIYFISDHQGEGRIYYCDQKGSKLNKVKGLADQKFYCKNLSSDGKSLVYQSVGELYQYIPKIGTDAVKHRKLNVMLSGNIGVKSDKFVYPYSYLYDYDLHPNGEHILISSRGKAMFGHKDYGGVCNIEPIPGVPGAGRVKHVCWLDEGREFVLVYEFKGEEFWALYDVVTCKQIKVIAATDFKYTANKKKESLLFDNSKSNKISIALQSGLKKGDIPGYVRDLKAFNKGKKVAFVNNRNQLLIAELNTCKIEAVEVAAPARIGEFDISPDDNWLVYSCGVSAYTSALILYDIKNKAKYKVAKEVLRDDSPTFSKCGGYIYFISARNFTPSWDSLHFEMTFQKGTRPYVMVLSKEGTLPFVKGVKSVEEFIKTLDDGKKKSQKKNEGVDELKIDLEGLSDRIYPLPLPSGLYSYIASNKSRVYWLETKEFFSEDDKTEIDNDGKQVLKCYSFNTDKVTTVARGVISFELTAKNCVYIDDNYQIYITGEKAEEAEQLPNKGCVDDSRFQFKVSKESEWEQIFYEAWRLQKEHSWAALLKNRKPEEIKKRYASLLPFINTRAELEDLIWEMQGDFGFSHAYVYGGDKERSKGYVIGKLGVEVKPVKDGLEIIKLVYGDRWDSTCTSPLGRCDIEAKVGDVITQVNGASTKNVASLGELLLNKAGLEVELKLKAKGIENKKKTEKGKNLAEKTVWVKTIHSEDRARYREWVEANRERIASQTEGKVGYIHIPDMFRWGFAEFHRNFLQESEKEGLVVDARYNGGGNVSSLLLEKLARTRLGFGIAKFFGVSPYPENAVSGKMVAITNEYAGSDGDIFTHVFKAMRLGPVIGKRTWGGVVGMWDRHHLVDNGGVTQPEYHTWFTNVGFGIENFGVSPDIEVDSTIESYRKGVDEQLERSIVEIKKILLNSAAKDFNELEKDLVVFQGSK